MSKQTLYMKPQTNGQTKQNSNRGTALERSVGKLLLCFRHLSENHFCLVLYTGEVHLQTFVMIYCKTICSNYLCTHTHTQNILIIGF